MLIGSALTWTYVGAGFSLFMVANLVYAVWRGSRQVAGSRSWAKVPGEILASKVDVEGSHTSDEDADCKASVRYRYTVAGKAYEGERVRFGGRAHTTRLIAEQTVAKYPAGRRVEVLCDPKHPKNAVLETKSATAPAIYALLVVFTAIATVLVAHSIAGKVLYAANGVPLFAFLLPAATIAMGLAGVVQFFKLRRLKSASARWPTVNGTITKSDVVEEVREDHDDNRSQRQELRYRPAVQFSYRVGGQDYSSGTRKWGWSEIYMDREEPQKIVAKYPKGASVPVHYDPANPENAVLEPANGGGTAAPLIFAAMFGGTGVLFFWFLLKAQF